MKQFSKIIFALSLFITIVCINILLTTISPNYFFQKFEKVNVYNNFTQNDIEYLNKEFSSILSYSNSSNSYLNADFFSKEDILHMQDVRELFQYVYTTLAVSILTAVAIFAFTKEKSSLLTAVSYIGVISIIAIILVSLSFGSNFSKYFTLFHEITFDNEYWLLDPNTSNLIKFLPEAIFREILFEVTLTIFSSTTLLSLFAIIAKRNLSKWHLDKKK